MARGILFILLIIAPGFTCLLSQETIKLIVEAGAFTMPASDVSLTASLELAEYTVTVSVVPEGAGRVSGEGNYNAGEEVNLEVVANVGYEFINWTDSVGYEISNNPAFTFTMPAEDVKVIANMDVVNLADPVGRHPDPGIILYPNPATNEFIILSEERMNVIEIAAYNGRVLYNRDVSGLEVRISTAGFQSGIYIVRIHTDIGVYFKKVVIL